MQHYENRLRRQALALEQIGEPIPTASVDVLLTKARTISEAPARPEERLKTFKREYAIGLLDDNTEETQLRSAALEQLLQ